MRNVVFAAPFPLEATLRFARGIGRLGAVRILGVGQEVPRGDDRALFSDFVTVADGLDAGQLARAVKELERRHGRTHRLVGILEPLQVQLAQVREALDIPGTRPQTADLFRDKARMKDALRAHGLPTAHHHLARSPADGEAFARRVGFPLVVKPPAGMGAKATFRVGSLDELAAGLRQMGASPEHPVLLEEFLKGEEFSFETITVGGEPRFHSISEYLPTPLTVLENDWIQWTCVLPRDISGAEFAEARRVGFAAVKSLGLDSGFTHMEWFRRVDGSVAIGEIAQRPPGAHITRMVGLAHDRDPYRAWARAVVDDALDGPWERKFAVGCAYLRGLGRGRVTGVEGLEAAQRTVAGMVEEARLPTVGAPKSDSYEGDGYVILRHAETEMVRRGLAAVVGNVRVHYG